MVKKYSGKFAPSYKASATEATEQCFAYRKAVYCLGEEMKLMTSTTSVTISIHYPERQYSAPLRNGSCCGAILLTESPKERKTGHPNGYRETRGKFAPSYKASAAEATEQCFDLPSRGAKLSGAVRFTTQVTKKQKTPPRLVLKKTSGRISLILRGLRRRR